jgi:transposase-like protein
MQSALSAPHFHNEQAAFAYVEARIWPNGPVCPHCKGTERIGALKGKTTRPGLYKCYACRKPFTVRMGTLFESSHVPLRYWLQAIYLMCASKKGISTRQLHRTFGGSLKTAWFLSHRIREAMKPVAGSEDPMGGPGGIVEGEYVRGIVHSNTAEGFYSVFKRGMIGIYQHCAEHHLRRYTAEFDFRYNTRVRLGINDKGRADMALRGVIGKRLTYRTTGGFHAAV